MLLAQPVEHGAAGPQPDELAVVAPQPEEQGAMAPEHCTIELEHGVDAMLHDAAAQPVEAHRDGAGAIVAQGDGAQLVAQAGWQQRFFLDLASADADTNAQATATLAITK